MSGFEDISEADFMGSVIEEAHLRGWLCAHFRPARTKHGWVTAVSADGAGFPDICLARDGQVVFLELKSATGRVTPEQQRWLDALPNAHLLRPADYHRLATILR